MIRALIIVALLASHARAEVCFGGPMPARPVIGDKPRVAGSGGMIVSEGETEVTVWHATFSCDHYITSWVQPKVGERVVLTWVDDAGRVSEPSKPLTISAAPRGK